MPSFRISGRFSKPSWTRLIICSTFSMQAFTRSSIFCARSMQLRTSSPCINSFMAVMADGSKPSPSSFPLMPLLVSMRVLPLSTVSWQSCLASEAYPKQSMRQSLANARAAQRQLSLEVVSWKRSRMNLMSRPHCSANCFIRPPSLMHRHMSFTFDTTALTSKSKKASVMVSTASAKLLMASKICLQTPTLVLSPRRAFVPESIAVKRLRFLMPSRHIWSSAMSSSTLASSGSASLAPASSPHSLISLCTHSGSALTPSSILPIISTDLSTQEVVSASISPARAMACFI
mmetsp:Transcript_87853/g.146737  ORF Transcript_87853/g.146737 Transcript_87853/m.146737 type:complete len:289 (+) Transcript_87853:1186-2052(+)